MLHATLLILNGPGRGTRYDVYAEDGDVMIGRSVGTKIRVDDTEASRQHAKIFHDGKSFRLQDLGSANGSYVNGHSQCEAVLHSGDTLRVGTTRLMFQLITEPELPTAMVPQVQLVDDSPSGQHSAIVQQVQAESGSSVSSLPDRRMGLELLYQVAEELVRPVESQDTLLKRILGLTLEAVRADRGCFLLRDSASGNLTPVVFAKRGAAQDTEEQMPISRSIAGYVLQHGRAVRTADALNDTRFAGGNSILSSGIREAICAPLRGQEELLGVLYLDITTNEIADGITAGRFSDEHLKSVLAVARQTALAVESRRFHDAMLKAERFAAMGQTVAVLSHHIKNILQGIGGAGYLIRTGLDKSDDDMVRQGWGIVERNQKRISDLVMDMLSFSKERVPELTTADLNGICADVIELTESAARENNVTVEFRPGNVVPPSELDQEGIHRAILNIIMNAIDAVAESEHGKVVLQTSYDQANDVMLVAVTDNGPGIPEDQRDTVFTVFESSKGSRGTGIGLPVSRKILREHGGQIRIEGDVGEGTRFVLSWPRGNPKSETIRLDSKTLSGSPSPKTPEA